MTTTNFLFELGTEELPPVALSNLSRVFTNNIKKGLDDAQLGYSDIQSFATPRRLAVLVNNLSPRQADSEETRLGPAVAAAFDADGEPTKAAIGFAKSCHVEVSELQQLETDKGLRLGLTIKHTGKASSDLLGDIVTQALQSLPIPKAMRWGDRNESFVRPVKWLVALIDADVLPLELFGCQSHRISCGHRFMSDGNVSIDTATSYQDALKQAYVLADIGERKQVITQQVEALAQEHKLNAVIDPDLLDEVAALVEWPVALVGEFETEFLSVPKEALISTMSKNQKYFHVLTDDGSLANRFVTISNIESTNPAAIIAGNEKVIRPRLADAKFFFEVDSKQSLTKKASKLENIVFQNKLGSVADKCHRLGNIAQQYAPVVGANNDLVKTAAAICKADLVTEMVGEFPNLQGIMGKYYAQNEGLANEICLSLEEIYLPKSANDQLPTTGTGTCLALADRIDTLVGIFGIGQTPSGNKDPYALRRAALGILRILLERNLDIDLADLVASSRRIYADTGIEIDPDTESQLQEFFRSRTRALYLDKGFSAQEISAVEALSITKPVDFDKRIQAVKSFSMMPESGPLASANKRVANIISKNMTGNIPQIEPELLVEPAEHELFSVYLELQQDIQTLCQESDYAEALHKLTTFSEPLEQFFDNVMVMSDDEATKNNRIALLAGVRQLFLAVADISCLQK